MSKRNKIVAVICIVVAALSFMGGMIYKYEKYIPMMQVTPDQGKYYFEYYMPLDTETAFWWLDWAGEFHAQMIIQGEKKGFEEGMPLEYHQDYWNLYATIKDMFFQFEEKWGIDE